MRRCFGVPRFDVNDHVIEVGKRQGVSKKYVALVPHFLPPIFSTRTDASRYRKPLSNEYGIVQIGFDTDDNIILKTILYPFLFARIGGETSGTFSFDESSGIPSIHTFIFNAFTDQTLNPSENEPPKV